MKKNILIVDAYNMIGNWPQLDKLKKSDRLEDARDLLLKILSNYRKQANFLSYYMHQQSRYSFSY